MSACLAVWLAAKFRAGMLMWLSHLANDFKMGQAVAGICLLCGLEAKVHSAGLCWLGAQLCHRQQLALRG